MKAGLMRLLVAGMVLVGMTAMAAEKAAAKASPVEKTGTVAAPAAGADAAVVGVLTAKDGTFNLTATGEAATAIKDAITKKASVVIKGELSKDGKSIAVASAKVAEAKKEEKKK